ncbi:putative Ig domain-containing protein [Motilimonas cestriensis]|uniref:Ig domain-containing protein n=1 Tax=Motilimonas cestriensis TaxID=2742685 RepID=A0ABS8W8F0_9GAMM|nr:kelch repeat-containing protein [Motilimonas cestriensis]MCE2594036.1 putative Ig domain-containing protein [Motilimonas cestriensis]
MPVLSQIKYQPVVGIALLLLVGCGGGGGGESNSEPNSVIVNGAVEKGPFIIGTNVTIGKLNNLGQPVDSTLTTQTTNDLGDFSFSYEKDTLVQIKANGYYRNEITGELSAGTLNLRSVYVVSSEGQQRAHVNILTHLTSNRVIELISFGSPAAEAISTAEDEMLTLLDEIVPSPAIDSFASLGLYDTTAGDVGNAYLTLISSLFYQYSLNLASGNSTSPDAELTLVLNELANDFADGNVEDTTVFESIKLAMADIDPIRVQMHLNEFARLANSSSTPSNINLFLDSDLDGVANEYDLDDDNDNILDEEDSAPYQENFVVGNIELQTDEDTDISFTLKSNNPKGDLIKYVITRQPSSGVLIGEFPNVTYKPNENFNGIDSVQLYLSQGDIFSDSVTITISVLSDNDVPVISGIPSSQIDAFAEYSFVPVTNDIDGDGLEFSIVNKPGWLNFSSLTGEISGIPTNENAGIYSNIEISASDGIEEVILAPFSITVKSTPWVPLASLPLETRGGAAAQYNGILYYFGGTGSDMKSVYAYDPLTDSWSAKASMPKGLHNLNAHTIGDKIYIVSGYGAGGFINDTFVYDPANDSWQTKEPRPTYRYVFSSAVVDDLIYVIGGQGTVDDGPWRNGVAWSYKNYVEIYNPKTDSWSDGQSAPTLLANNDACVLDQKIYVLGGDAGSGATSSVQVYDPMSDSWSTSLGLTSSREALSCSVIGQELFVFGGRNSGGALDLVESYDLVSGGWSTRHPMSDTKYWFPTVLYDNKVFTFGGYTGSSRLQAVESYDPSTDL